MTHELTNQAPRRCLARLVRWCVKHRDGWCACKVNAKPAEDSISVETACDHYVTLPYGFQKRKPTCPDCISANDQVEAREK
jgi:hypothetical protein